MKKLMIALAAVAMAAGVQAASIDWKCTSGTIKNGGGDEAKNLASKTVVYLFFGDSTSADTLVKSYTATSKAADIQGAALTTAAINSKAQFSKTGATISTAGGLSGQQAYFVIFNNDMMYVSDVVNATWSDFDTKYDAQWGAQTETSAAGPLASSGGYKGAHWYNIGSSPEPTPEPTSGLLLLLGVAGLALRRKRA